jgi:hypothetical protein
MTRLFSCLVDVGGTTWTLKMKAVSSSETSVTIYILDGEANKNYDPNIIRFSNFFSVCTSNFLWSIFR